MDIKPALTDAEFLSLVPAGGMGTRLGVLTAARAKPALAIGFSHEGYIERMIDVPLRAIRQLGGAALVSTKFAADTLNFVDEYSYAQTRREAEIGSPIDTLVNELPLLEASKSPVVGIIPGDAYITPEMLEGMHTVFTRSAADAMILATRHLEGHNVRSVDGNNLMTTPDKAADRVADLGVHLLKREWLLEQLKQLTEQGVRSDVWGLYGVDRPKANVLLHVPKHDTVAIDMGTGEAFHSIVSQHNARHADRHGNIVFPGAKLGAYSTETVALPSSTTSIPLKRVTVPEGTTVHSMDQVLLG